jgi:hypothetical protein
MKIDEALVQERAEQVAAELKIDIEEVTPCVVWAMMWREEYELMLEEGPGYKKEVMGVSRTTSLLSALAQGLAIPTRRLNGPPTPLAIAVANEAFCLGFGEEAEVVRGVLQPSPESAQVIARGKLEEG